MSPNFNFFNIFIYSEGFSFQFDFSLKLDLQLIGSSPALTSKKTSKIQKWSDTDPNRELDFGRLNQDTISNFY